MAFADDLLQICYRGTSVFSCSVVVEENNKNVVVVKEEENKRNLMVVVVYSFTIHEAVLKKTSVKFECGLAGGSI